jgi:hypothetical protein
VAASGIKWNDVVCLGAGHAVADGAYWLFTEYYPPVF